MIIKQYYIYKAIFCLIAVFCFSFNAIGQEVIQDVAISEIENLKSLFIQIVALLGASIIVYLYINFRNNKQKRHKFSIATAPKNDAQDISSTINKLVNLMPYAACIANENQKIIAANAAFDTMIKHTGADYGQTWDQYLKIETQKLDLSDSDEAIAKCENNRTLKLSIKPLPIENLKKPLYTIIVEDISHLQHQAKNYRQQKHYFKAIICKSSMPIIVCDGKGQIIEANANAYDLLETTTLNRNLISTYIPQKERDHLLDRLHTTSLDHYSNNTFNILTSTQKEIPVELNIIPVDFFGAPAYFFLFKDISERIHVEQEIIKAKVLAEESDRLKSSFLANMSHEVRTPLNSIMGFTELMSDELISHEERKEFHQIVKTSSNELLALLNDIMEFSKIESGLVKLSDDELQPHTICRDLSEYIQKQLADKPNIKFNTNEPIGLKNAPTIISDNKRIKQVLTHLVDNAIKFTYNGSITLSYQYRLDNTLEFIISDTGIGIPQEKIPNIFHKFRQASDDNSRDFGGAGLGLSICKNLANALGGFLWVSSTEQVGSDFHFVLPTKNIDRDTNSTCKTFVFYSNKPMATPKPMANINYLALFNFTALLNVPLAHNLTAILLNEALSDSEMKKLLAIPKVQSLSILVLSDNKTTVKYSPLAKEIGLEFESSTELKKYLTKCCNRELV